MSLCKTSLANDGTAVSQTNISGADDTEQGASSSANSLADLAQELAERGLPKWNGEQPWEEFAGASLRALAGSDEEYASVEKELMSAGVTPGDFLQALDVFSSIADTHGDDMTEFRRAVETSGASIRRQRLDGANEDTLLRAFAESQPPLATPPRRPLLPGRSMYQPWELNPHDPIAPSDYVRSVRRNDLALPDAPRQRADKSLTFDYKNVELLSRYLTEGGKIMPRYLTKLSAKQQRHMARAVKQARVVGLIPYTSKSPRFSDAGRADRELKAEAKAAEAALQ